MWTMCHGRPTTQITILKKIYVNTVPIGCRSALEMALGKLKEKSYVDSVPEMLLCKILLSLTLKNFQES
jgi:hypothetical protein